MILLVVWEIHTMYTLITLTSQSSQVHPPTLAHINARHTPHHAVAISLNATHTPHHAVATSLNATHIPTPRCSHVSECHAHPTQQTQTSPTLTGLSEDMDLAEGKVEILIDGFICRYKKASKLS